MKTTLTILVCLALSLVCTAKSPHLLEHEIRFGKLSFVESDLVTVLEYIRLRAQKDRPDWFTGEVAFEYRFAPTKSFQKVSMELQNVTLWEALNKIGEKVGLTVEIRDRLEDTGRFTFTDAKAGK